MSASGLRELGRPELLFMDTVYPMNFFCQLCAHFSKSVYDDPLATQWRIQGQTHRSNVTMSLSRRPRARCLNQVFGRWALHGCTPVLLGNTRYQVD